MAAKIHGTSLPLHITALAIGKMQTKNNLDMAAEGRVGAGIGTWVTEYSMQRTTSPGRAGVTRPALIRTLNLNRARDN